MIPLMTSPCMGTDFSRVSPARLHNFLLGGKDHYPIDRAAGEDLLAQVPELAVMAHATRSWHRRAVQFMASAGINQFLDLGSGFPTINNTHEVAWSILPGARVVYVDHDPLVAAHSRALLATDPERTAVVQADLRNVDNVLNDPDVLRLLDCSQPVGLTMTAVLDSLPHTDRPHDIVRSYREMLAPKSYLALTHLTTEVSERAGLLEQAEAHPYTPRPRQEISHFFDGTELVHPGLTYVRDWRPPVQRDTDRPPAREWVLGGVGLI